MFCSKCGKELKNDEAFCPNCGAGVTNQKSLTYEGGKNGFGEKLAKLIGSTDGRFGKKTIIICVAMLAAGFLLSCCPVFIVSAMGVMERGISLYYETSTLIVFFIICYSISAGLIITLISKNEEWKPVYFLAGKITIIISLAWFLLMISYVKDTMSKDAMSSMLECSISFIGWLYLLVTIGTFLLLFFITGRIKKQKRQKINEINNNNIETV